MLQDSFWRGCSLFNLLLFRTILAKTIADKKSDKQLNKCQIFVLLEQKNVI